MHGRRGRELSAMVAAGALLLGCGGHSKHDAVAGSGGTGLEPPDSAGGANEASAGEPALRGCPDASWGSCSSRFTLTVSTTGRSDGRDGAWIEPLRVDPPPPSPLPPSSSASGPASWDRSDMPAGACVFRAHGVPAACFGVGGQVTYGRCGSPPPHVVPLSYYELSSCGEGIAPGCPRLDAPLEPQSYAWYAAAEADGTVTLVLCARLCELLLNAGEGCFAHAGG